MTPNFGQLHGRNVLFVHQSADLYGSDRVLLECAIAVDRAGAKAIVALPSDGPLVAALQAAGVRTHVLRSGELLKLERSALSLFGIARLAAGMPASLRALDRVVADTAVDLVCSSTLAVLGGALWARMRGLRHVWHVHEMVERPAWLSRLFALALRACANAVICNSNATLDFYARHQTSLRARSRVVWNGVPDPRLNAGDLGALKICNQRFRPHGETLAIGLVGRINRCKGHALLIDAAEAFHVESGLDFSLVFIGSAPPGQTVHLDRLRARIARSPIRDRVVLCDFIQDTRVAYAALDIVCVPSTENEAFGLVAVEAMAACRAVVAARIGGLPEVVTSWQTGLLHVAGNASSLAEALSDVARHELRRLSLATAGRQRYERNFTVRHMTDGVLDVFASTIRHRPSVTTFPAVPG